MIEDNNSLFICTSNIAELISNAYRRGVLDAKASPDICEMCQQRSIHELLQHEEVLTCNTPNGRGKDQ